MTLPVFRASRLLSAAAVLLAAHAVMAQVPAATQAPDHSSAYYHEGLASMYEDMAVNAGRPDYATQAVEEYKLALSADPNSQFLQDGLADLYFKLGRIREAVTAAQDQVKKNPNDFEAHSLLGKVYLRSLGDMQGSQSGEMLKLAIAEYETISKLKPEDVETHLLLGQLYGLNHDSAKAEGQFKLAQHLDSNSEEVVLNMARLYEEQGDTQRAVDTLASVPEADRSERIDLALAGSYEILKRPKDAAASYKAALEENPDNVDAQKGLASALLQDNRLDEALVVLQQLVATDANDVQSQVRISDIQRRQGHYTEALATLKKAKSLPAQDDNEELSYNEALIYDSLGQYDKATASLTAILKQTAHPDGKYSDPEKSNRSIFLDRLGIVEREANKTPEAIAAYKEEISLGGEYVSRGYQGEVDAYRDAHLWKELLAAAAEAAQALPRDHSVQLMYAFQLADTGKPDEGIALAKAQLSSPPGEAGTSDGTQDRDTYVALANMNLRLKRSKDAYAALDKAEALTMRPEEKAFIYRLRATIADRDKDYAEAEIQYKKAIAIDPNDATALNDFGYMLAERGTRLAEAQQMITHALELDPQNGAFLDSLGWVNFKAGKYEQAEQNLKKAIERVSTDASIHDHLGEVYDKTGRLKLAVSQWERAMTEYAHSLPADADPADVAKVKRKLDNARVKLASAKSPTAKKVD
ncbi:Tetratricopeptide repeat-containing protein [Granulicella rosea]|uniref:Tetratricopeptide repeat-containing protein n=1 Tax=Granulicella rosea TaxID=474952 RepID=A0A239HSV7_9BACT|nr:tetratricopeptide repeat protein [Granulicella rosea]SNS84390.1 Tetratricopeptide repeat-containing protein [Granulicella rosea]